MKRIKFYLPSGGMYPIRAKIVGKPKDLYGFYTSKDSAESFYHAVMGLLEEMPPEVVKEFQKMFENVPPTDYFKLRDDTNNFLENLFQGNLEKKVKKKN
jgi:hypothetical protein